MKFNGFEQMALGSPAKIQVLRFLLGGGSGSQREIARQLGLSAMTVTRVMKDFAAVNIVTPRKTGGAVEWKLNIESWAYQALRPLGQARTDPLAALKEKLLLELRGVREAYLTGSVAAGKETPTSDIDLVVVVENEDEKKRLLLKLEPLKEQCISLFGNILSPFILTFVETKKRQPAALLEKARKTGVRII